MSGSAPTLVLLAWKHIQQINCISSLFFANHVSRFWRENLFLPQEPRFSARSSANILDSQWVRWKIGRWVISKILIGWIFMSAKTVFIVLYAIFSHIYLFSFRFQTLQCYLQNLFASSEPPSFALSYTKVLNLKKLSAKIAYWFLYVFFLIFCFASPEKLQFPWYAPLEEQRRYVLWVSHMKPFSECIMGLTETSYLQVQKTVRMFDFKENTPFSKATSHCTVYKFWSS